MSAQRCNELRLTGSGGANRVMEAELKRLVMRSPFDVRVEKPKREGEATLLYPFDARVAWVAACHHRTSSRISWDLCSSTAVRLEPLFDDLLPALSSDDRLPGGTHLRFSVEVGPSSDFEASPLQLRGVVKNAIVEALASRGVASDVDADSPDVVFVVRRAGTPEARRTVVGIDIGGGARHRRGARVAAGPAPLRETHGGAADHVVALGRAHRAPRRSDGWRRHDSDRGGRPRGGRRHSSPVGSPAAPSRRVQGSAARSARPVPRNRAADRRARRRRRSAFPRWWATFAPPG